MNKEILYGYIKLCREELLKENEGKRFLVEDTEVALFKVCGEIYALGNICPHQHSALIYEGFIEEGCVICPLHGWKFQLKDGTMPSGRKGLASYQVKVADGDVYVKILKKGMNW